MDTAVIDIVKELQQIRIDIQNNQQKLEDTVQSSLLCVDKLQHMLDEVFDLTTAVALCKAGFLFGMLIFQVRKACITMMRHFTMRMEQ